MLRVGVFGAAGRMGATVCRAVAEAVDLELVAAVDPGAAGGAVSRPGQEPITIAADPRSLVEAGAEVAIDFTRAAAAMANLRFCAAERVHAVCGTTGLTPDDVGELRSLYSPTADGDGANCVWAPNFAVGAVLLMHFAEIAARHLDALEVIELHHDRKLDAPSGTAIETVRRATAARAAAGRGPWPADSTEKVLLEGARGAEGEGGARVHSVRLPGLVAHQEVIFGAPGQSLTIRHDSYDRISFMPGVLLATRRVPGLAGLTVGMDALLGLGGAPR
jgi:4-hydroxy-tetrahydrodipicolinate reductase